MENTIFYFTGTGNSLAVAKKISNDGKEFQLLPMVGMLNEDKVEITCNKVGFIFPVYFAGLPNIVKKFMEKVTFDKQCYIFAIVTCGFTWSGYALNQLKAIIIKKKQKLSAGYYIAMVDNFLPKYNIPSMEKQLIISQNCEEKIEVINKQIKNNDTFIEIEKGFLLYLMYPMFLMFIKRYDAFFKTDGRCNSCTLCQSVCPVNNIIICEGKPKWLHKCEFCMACINYCPQNTIQWGKFTSERGRYHHKEISAKEIIKQNNSLKNTV